MIAAADVHDVLGWELGDPLVMASRHGAPIGADLAPAQRDIQRCRRIVRRPMIDFHPDRVEPARPRCRRVGVVDQVLEEHRSDARRDSGDGFVVDDVIRLADAGEVVGPRPRDPAVERVQIIDVGPGLVVVQPSAVHEPGDIGRRIHPVCQICVLVQHRRIGDRRVCARHRGGLRRDVARVVRVFLPQVAAEIRPQHHRVGLIAERHVHLVPAEIQPRKRLDVHLRQRRRRSSPSG